MFLEDPLALLTLGTCSHVILIAGRGDNIFDIGDIHGDGARRGRRLSRTGCHFRTGWRGRLGRRKRLRVADVCPPFYVATREVMTRSLICMVIKTKG